MNSPRTERACRRLRRSGQSLVELALIATILLMAVMCVVDIGLHVSAATQLPLAARATALLLTPSNNNYGTGVRPTQAIEEVIRTTNSQTHLNLHRDAQITVSYITRSSNTTTSISAQYVKGMNQAASVNGTVTYQSRIGVAGGNTTLMVPASTLASSSDWVVAVEVFYQPRYITPAARLLNIGPTGRVIYEKAIY